MKEITLSIQNFSKAVEKLNKGVDSVQDELDIDGVIQRFEFTFELFWKTLKLIMYHDGISCQSPRNCIKEGHRHGYIDDGELFLDMLADRNMTTHLYDESRARDIYQRIKNQYVTALNKAKVQFKAKS